MKILTIFSLTASLCCCDAQNSDLENLRDEMVDFGTVVFVDFLEREDCCQRIHERLKRVCKIPEKRRLFTLAQTMREIFDKFFLPYMDIYPQALKNETIVEIWKEVDSDYLPGAPPIYNKPMEFFSFLLAKAVVKSQTLNMLEAGLDTVRVIGKIDFNQLYEEVQMVLVQIRKKAFEISTLKRQKEKNDFLISLRTASGLIVFYWDKVLEQTESPSFHSKYLDSKKRWTELTQLRNASEKYHELLDSRTGQKYLNFTEEYFGEFLETLSEEYYSHGNEAFGSERFIQSNWAVVKSAVVYYLPVYEKLSEVGFGFTEVNRFLHRTNRIALGGEDRDSTDDHETFFEFSLVWFHFLILYGLVDEFEDRDNITVYPLLLPLRYSKNFIQSLCFVSKILGESEVVYDFEPEDSYWNLTKSNLMDELVKSKAFTREQIEETLNKSPVHQIVEKLEQYIDLVEDYDESVDKIVSTIKYLLYVRIKEFEELWDLMT